MFSNKYQKLITQFEKNKNRTWDEWLKFDKLLDNQENRGWDKHPADKVYKPNEDWTGLDDFIKRYAKKYDHDEQFIKNTVNDFMKTEGGKQTIFSQFERSLWPKQIKQAIVDLGIDDKNYFVP